MKYFTSKSFINYIIYVIFTIYSISVVYHAKDYRIKIIFSIGTLFILSIVLYYEYLQYLYRKAIYELAYLKDTEKGRNTFNQLMKKDIFKGFKHNEKIFMILYYTDTKEYQKCLTILNNHPKFFHSSLDMLLIQHFTRFYCYYHLNKIEEMKKEYQALMKLKDKKIKGVKVSPLYHYDFIQGIYYAGIKKQKQAINCLKKVNTANMNPREIQLLENERNDLMKGL